ncbi:hypothetical protein BHE74_00055714 [Ensete ventricosum]|uniref:Uncharacterized protein n=1 Tax=Ensete ventricosum TaxID=4639 RepID=A0A444GI92_ENSVE|nr:hypothetical protein B296_00030875 [Ensete ventricosum]RWW34501.1 hypothetical protein GW17_00000743 [Ensete ventricosum]RWW39002.1 hypothetical protein BHE74_00055714 [Ensete ventricosum]RZS24362.1 hypothetical protein BHM03_00057423 [Ensete ventricosum]
MHAVGAPTPALVALPPRPAAVSRSLERMPWRPPSMLLLPTRRANRGMAVRMAPEEEKMTRRSPLDFPIEWERPKPGRRPDIFPKFSPMKTPLPTPLPEDPPEEDEEEDEEVEKEEDPDKEEPEEPEVST